MIGLLSSRRMTLVVIILIITCTIVVIIEELFTDNSVDVSGSASTSSVETLSQQPVNKDIGPADVVINPAILNPGLLHDDESLDNTQTNWRQYLMFMSLTGFFGSISGLLVKHRQQQLHTKSLARFRKHHDSDSSPNESNHTLIDMNHSA